jgi:hypothetical protein
MGRKKSEKKPKTVEGKLNDIDKSFVEEIRLGTVEAIKERMIKLDRYESELETAKKEDQDLASKREELKVANQTYSEPLAAIKLKRAFALQVLTEKGSK